MAHRTPRQRMQHCGDQRFSARVDHSSSCLAGSHPQLWCRPTTRSRTSRVRASLECRSRGVQMCSCRVGVVHQQDPTLLDQLAPAPVGITGRGVALDRCSTSAQRVDDGMPDLWQHAQGARERVMVPSDLSRGDHNDSVVPVGSYTPSMAFEERAKQVGQPQLLTTGDRGRPPLVLLERRVQTGAARRQRDRRDRMERSAKPPFDLATASTNVGRAVKGSTADAADVGAPEVSVQGMPQRARTPTRPRARSSPGRPRGCPKAVGERVPSGVPSDPSPYRSFPKRIF